MGEPGAVARLAGLVLILAMTLATWRLLDLQRSSQIQTLVEREIDFASDVLLRDLQARHAAAAHFARQWERGMPPSAAEFYADAQDQLDNTPGLYSVSFADAAMVLRHVVPSEFRAMEGRSIVASEGRRTSLEQARVTRRTVLSAPVDLMDGSGTGFLMYVPLFAGERFEGVLISVFHASHWLTHLFGAGEARDILPGFALDITMNGTTLYQSADFAATVTRHATDATLRWHDVALALHARPRPDYYASHWHWAPESLAAVVFLSLSALAGMMALVRRARAAEAQARVTALELMGVNANLREEAEVRRLAEVEAEAARAATARFLATMSHEIRTPLNAILGMFQLISVAEPLPDKQRKQAHMGIEAARRLHRDLSNVLDVSRLDAGALPVRIEETELGPLATAWGSALEAFVMRSEKPITCVVEIDPDLPSVAEVDAAALTQVVHNLIDNAVKFTEAGAVTLQVRAEEDCLRIIVADTGIGIDPARRDSVFERFYQVEEGIERRFSGTGLGLSITRDLVSLMHGHIEMRDNSSRGTIFDVCLPGALTHIIPIPPVLASDTGQDIRV